MRIAAFSLNIAPALKATFTQEENNLFESRVIKKNRALTFTWPVDDATISSRSADTAYANYVGATIVYQPALTADQPDVDPSTVPSDPISIYQSALFDAGQLTFTPDDLALLPHHGIVSLYTGRARYQLDANGQLVQIPWRRNTRTRGGSLADDDNANGTVVFSGSIQGAPRMHVEEF